MGSNGAASIDGINDKVVVYVDSGVLNGSVNEEVVERLVNIRSDGVILAYVAHWLADYLELRRLGIPQPDYLVAGGKTPEETRAGGLFLYTPVAGERDIVVQENNPLRDIEEIVERLGHKGSIGVGGTDSALLRATAHKVTILPNSDGMAYGLVGAMNGTFSYKAKDAMEGLNHARSIAGFVMVNPRE